MSITVAWLANEEKTGVVGIIGFHDDFESVGEIHPPYVVIDAIPALPANVAKIRYDFDTGQILWDTAETPQDEIAALKAENAELKKRQTITEAALSELIDITIGGGA